MGNSGYNWDTERKENSEKIINYIKEHGSISSREARTELGIADFRYYLKYLEKQGYKLSVTEVNCENQKGDKVTSFIYTL